MIIKKSLVSYYIPGFFWLLIGAILLKKGLKYLLLTMLTQKYSSGTFCLIIVFSLSLGLVKYTFVFKKIVINQLQKNTLDIPIGKKMFSIKKVFMAIVMIGLGKTLNQFINPLYLSSLKIAVGFSFVLSSITYTYSLSKNILKHQL